MVEMFGVSVGTGGVGVGVLVGRGGGVFVSGMGCGVSEAGGVITFVGVEIGVGGVGFCGVGVAERVGVGVGVAVGVCDGVGVFVDDDDGVDIEVGVGCVSGEGASVGSGVVASVEFGWGVSIAGVALGLALGLAVAVGDSRPVRPEGMSCSTVGRDVWGGATGAFLVVSSVGGAVRSDGLRGVDVGDWVCVGVGSGRMDEPVTAGKMFFWKRPAIKSANNRTATVGASQLNVRLMAGRLKRERLAVGRLATAVRNTERPGRRP